MIREGELKKMKRDAILINVSRGESLTTALYKARKDRWIPEAGLDVLEKEPVTRDTPLLELDNAIIPPYSLVLDKLDRRAPEEGC